MLNYYHVINDLKKIGKGFLIGAGLVGLLGCSEETFSKEKNKRPLNTKIEDSIYQFKDFGKVIEFSKNSSYIDIEMADVDGDGDVDLIIGFKDNNLVGNKAGSVFIYENKIPQKNK